MVDGPKNMAASVKARLLAMAREQGRAFDLLLVRFALERLLFRLSLSPHRYNYVLKGGMLVTQWLEHDNRETRDIDFLGFGPADEAAITAIFAEIMTIETGDALVDWPEQKSPEGDSQRFADVRVWEDAQWHHFHHIRRRASAIERHCCGAPKSAEARVASPHCAAEWRWSGHLCNHVPDRQVQDLCLAMAGALHA